VGFYEGGDVWLVKTDALGNMEWNQTYGGTGGDLALSLVATSDGGYALAGTWNYTLSLSSEGGGDFWLVKTDEFGNTQWDRKYGGTGEDLAYSLIATSDDGYALAGAFNFSGTFGTGSADAWLVKTDSLGDMEWNGTYGGTGDDWACSVIATSDGGYALAGTLNYVYYLSLEDGGDYHGDFWFVKTDELGVVPEYSSWLIPSIVLATSLFMIVNKKRLLHKRS